MPSYCSSLWTRYNFPSTPKGHELWLTTEGHTCWISGAGNLSYSHSTQNAILASYLIYSCISSACVFLSTLDLFSLQALTLFTDLKLISESASIILPWLYYNNSNVYPFSVSIFLNYVNVTIFPSLYSDIVSYIIHSLLYACSSGDCVFSVDSPCLFPLQLL